MDFNKFREAIRAQFDKLAIHDLYTTDIEKDALWEAYLASFPDGTNPIYKERTEHDCQCCKQFIRACGNTVAIINGDLVSIWDINVDDDYQIVADSMSALVKSAYIKDAFFHNEQHLGTQQNHQVLADGSVKKWDHLHYTLPNNLVIKNNLGTVLSDKRSNKEVLQRSLDELTLGAAETVLELIDQGSLYRGEEHKAIIAMFIINKAAYNLLANDHERDTFSWSLSTTLGGASKIRNTAIGTLLVDLSDNKELDGAVASFEAKVAPQNYKRPTALITQGMIKKAQDEVEALGITDSLQRRYAVTDDITINNVLYADRSIKEEKGVFDELSDEVKVSPASLEKVEEVHIDTFIESILPKADSIEVLFENRQSNNLMSLVAPANIEAPNILAWDNNFSWSYSGEMTDSIKEKVKAAGGNVDGVLRASLSWFNFDDLDIHVIEPEGNHIYYGNKRNSISTGHLDVDMNVHANDSRDAVENITWTDKDRMAEGIYKVIINNYTPREAMDVGFVVEIEYDGTIHTFHYDKRVSADVTVAEFKFSKEDGITFINSIGSTLASKTIWCIGTQQYHKVAMIMQSPNHWDGQAKGNKHWFFILDKCVNEEKTRGLYNEFLNPSLRDHRKVFEVLGSKMKTEKSDDQLSGLGFSSTQRNSVFCKVTGSFSRTIKITF